MATWAHSLGGPLLDLACGTGRMSLRLAKQGYQMVGVDVVPEMIEHARLKAAAQGVAIEWVVADARNFQLNRQFPGIFMLMNAFQFLHTRQDLEAMLACVREHLQPDGYFLFETRNPSPQNLLEVRHLAGQQYVTAAGGQLVVNEQQYYDPLTQVQHYTRFLQITHPDGQIEERTNRTGLRYIYPQEMEALLHYNRFKIHACYGDWQQGPLTATALDMIYVCQRLDQ